MAEIYRTNFTLQRAKNKTIVRDVIVSGNDKEALMADEFYLKRALKLIDQIKEWPNYKVVDIEFLTKIGETNE